jgi:phosphoenolpyruvate carboxykinase (ATP)
VESTDSDILNPRGTWADESAYDIPAIKLVGMFRENFKKFEAHAGQDVRDVAPRPLRLSDPSDSRQQALACYIWCTSTTS